MKKTLLVAALCLLVGFTAISCGQKKAASGTEAIDNAKAYETVQEKVTYLMGQADAFYKSEDFQSAVEVAQYVLSQLDSKNTDAKDLLAKAKSALKEQAKQALDNVSTNLGK
jgi:hypothetical protein